jgi:hypothetical protein
VSHLGFPDVEFALGGHDLSVQLLVEDSDCNIATECNAGKNEHTEQKKQKIVTFITVSQSVTTHIHTYLLVPPA